MSRLLIYSCLLSLPGLCYITARVKKKPSDLESLAQVDPVKIAVVKVHNGPNIYVKWGNTFKALQVIVPSSYLGPIYVNLECLGTVMSYDGKPAKNNPFFYVLLDEKKQMVPSDCLLGITCVNT